MIRLFKHYIPHAVLVLACVDALILFVAGEAAWHIRPAQIDRPAGSITERLVPTLIYVTAVEISLIAFGTYRPQSLRSLDYAIVRILIAVGMGVLLLSVFDLFVQGDILPRFVLLYATVLAIALLIINRAVLGPLLGISKFQRKILILGAGKRAQRLYELSLQRDSSFVIVDFVNMGVGPVVVEKAMPRTSIANLGNLVARRKVTEVVLAQEEHGNILPLKDLQQIRAEGIRLCGFSSFMERETGRVEIDTLDPGQLVFSDNLSDSPMFLNGIKRAFDILISGIILVLTWPLLVLAAIMIKLESKGSVFDRQTRIGLYGEPFEVIRLRGVKQAEGQEATQFDHEDALPPTRIRAAVQFLKIDELPQLWNVLKGKMSIVGPRAELSEKVASLTDKHPVYELRHMVKPGMTGWARTNLSGGMSLDVSQRELEYDLYYVKHRSFSLDALIMLRAARVTRLPRRARLQ